MKQLPKSVVTTKLAAASEWPAVSQAILAMYPVETRSIPTFAVDRYWRLYYNPDFLAKISKREAIGVILHEVCHLVWSHAVRAEVIGVTRLNHTLWNIAADFVINVPLKAERIDLPEGAVYPTNYDLPVGMSAEWYFSKLLERARNNGCFTVPKKYLVRIGRPPGAGDGAGADGPGEAGAGAEAGGCGGKDTQPGGENNPSAGGSKDTCQADGGDGAEAGEIDITDGSASEYEPAGGSSADGVQRSWELGEPSEKAPGLDEDEGAMLAEAAVQSIAKSRGTKGAAMKRAQKGLLRPKVDPKAELLQFIHGQCKSALGPGSRSFRRPNRRSHHTGTLMPSSRRPTPRFSIIIDSSGSMRDDSDLRLAKGLIQKVIESFRIRSGIKVYTGDTSVRSKSVVYSDPSSLDIVGNGGTSMDRIIKEILDDQPRPQLIIVVTDGDTPWPDEQPSIPVVACITRKGGSSYFTTPSWLKSINIHGRE